MSTVTTRTCDKCNTIVPDGEELWTLGIMAKCVKSVEQNVGYAFKTHNLPYVKDEYRRDYCRDCVLATGMVRHEAEEKAPKKTPTLDELLQEIVEDAVQDAMEP